MTMRAWLNQQPQTVYWLVSSSIYQQAIVQHFCLNDAVSLFEGAMFDEVMMLSPWIVPISSSCPYSDDDLSQGLFLTSDAAQSEIVAHLRSLLIAGLEGEEVFFRFYDPEVIIPMLQSMNKSDKQRFLGNLSTFSYWTESEMHTVTNNANKEFEPVVEPWWVLKPEHFKQSTDLELLANHIERRLWEKIPHIMNAQENHHRTILSALEDGRDKGYSSEYSELKVLAEIHRCAADDVKNIVQTFHLSVEDGKQLECFLGEIV